MKIITYLVEGDETPKANTYAEFEAGKVSADWSEYVWQDQPDKETAIKRHYEAYDLWEANPRKDFY